MKIAGSLIGQRFGRWMVTDLVLHKKKPRWLCRCDCGTTRAIPRWDLTSGQTASCGCLRNERLVKHGLGRSREYHAWYGLVQRCVNPENPNYHYYGARGIAVCDRWLGENGLVHFYVDMGPKPVTQGIRYSVERIDNEKPYSPDNCRWATAAEQAVNRRNTRFATFYGITHPVITWCREYGVSYEGVLLVIKDGHTNEDAISHAIKNKNRRRSK